MPDSREEKVALPQDNADNISTSSDNEYEETLTETPTVVDLKNEIETLKTTMMGLVESFNRLSSMGMSNTRQPVEMEITSNTTPAGAACPTHTMPKTTVAPSPPGTEPFEHQKLREYSTPYLPHVSFASAQTRTQTIANNPPPPERTSTRHPSLSSQIYSTPVTSQTPTVSYAYSGYNQNVPYVGNVNAQLRKLHDLPQFSGRPEQWPMFINSYRETTSHFGYSNLENLIRLQKSLVGDARSKVEAFLIHPNSVCQVMDTLDFHYGRPQMLIRSQIAKVRAFPCVTGKRMHEIINLSTMVSNLATFLENSNANPHLNNPTLLDELVNKLPIYKREEWMKHSTINLGPYPNLRDFSSWLHDVATYVSLAVEIDPYKTETTCSKREKANPSFTITTESKFSKCLMCSHDHQLYNCTQFKGTLVPERWNFVKRHNLCFSCLRVGHSSAHCRIKRQCNLFNCVKYHNRLLHENTNSNENKNKSVLTADNRDGNNSVGKNPAIGDGKNSPVNTITEETNISATLFKFLPVKLTGPKGSVEIVAFIDEGSKVTLLENEIATKIGLKGTSCNLRLGWIGGKTTDEVSKKVDVEVSPVGGKCYWFQMKNVWTTKNLNLPPQCLNLNNFKRRFSALNEIDVDDYDAKPQLLIGLPHIRLVRPYSVLNLDESFAVHETNLGNILFGSDENSVEAMVCRVDFEILEDIQRQVTEYFALENLGVKHNEPTASYDDRRAEEILAKTTKKLKHGYETGLLWRYDLYHFKNTYPMALKRLQTMEIKMKKDQELSNWYKAKIDDYISKSYVRKLTVEESQIICDRIWYLPHFVVTNRNKQNKRRLVFDAAAYVDDESFNTRLMKGPDKYQPKSLLHILFKFRQGRIAVCADVKEMFHRVSIKEEDQVAQRFLWREDTSGPVDQYVMQAMIFGSVSSPCSAQYVKNINAESYKDTHPRAYRGIVECHYVDDYVDSFDDIDEAITVCKDVTKIQGEAAFELRGFVSNSENVLIALDDIADTHKKSDLTSLCDNESMTEKILGMHWLPSEDVFCFVLKFSRVPESVLRGERKPTKREVLSLTMSIFDPYGFLANAIVKSKIILQQLWLCNVDWNSSIPDNIYAEWFKWYQSLHMVKLVKVPRWYGLNPEDSSVRCDLHIFADASELAYAAVAYWRIFIEDKVHIAYIAGKSRCAPLKPLSIPRLELQAAVLGIRLKESIILGHDRKPNAVTFWSDSKTVIKWIRSDARTFKQFVAHRLSEILESSTAEQWRWVPGSENPADDATRPQNFSQMSANSAWLKGPTFLESDPVVWPRLPDDTDDYDCQIERRSKFTFATIEDSVIPFGKYSCFNKLVRVTCWIRRAVKKFKSIETECNLSLNVDEMKEAITYLCKAAQREYFSEEFDKLTKGKTISKTSSIYKLTPLLGEDGLIRLSGRIENASCLPIETIHPIILPKNHPLTKLIVMHYHVEYKHQNQESICAAIRLKYWIPSLRQLVRSARRKCQTCKNRSAVPKPPLMGQHPMDRLTPFVRPFTYAGVDYMGPFLVTIGRRSEKRWVALFTCLTMRAVHLEMARDLSTESFILCLRNFINRRGLPVHLRSDRGTNFVGASKEEIAFDATRVADECARKGIKWIFNVPANPSAGGAWERMVRSVKNVLKFTLKEKRPQVDTLQSLLIEAENLVNSRPLTHVPIDTADSEPITPNHFLIGCPNTLQTPAVPDKVCLRKQWQILQQLKQTFWKRWVLEYLPELMRRTKWHQPVRPIRIGDVVIICDDNETRGEWKRGVVEKVFAAADGQVRSAEVRTLNGILRRPASKLAVLEVGVGEPSKSTHGGPDVMN